MLRISLGPNIFRSFRAFLGTSGFIQVLPGLFWSVQISSDWNYEANLVFSSLFPFFAKKRLNKISYIPCSESKSPHLILDIKDIWHVWIVSKSNSYKLLVLLMFDLIVRKLLRRKRFRLELLKHCLWLFIVNKLERSLSLDNCANNKTLVKCTRQLSLDIFTPCGHLSNDSICLLHEF